MQNAGIQNQCLPCMYIFHIYCVYSISNIMCSLKYFILWRYIVDGSETGDISQGDVSWNRFSHNCNMKWEPFFRQYAMTKRKGTHMKDWQNIWNDKQMPVWGGGTSTWTAGWSSGSGNAWVPVNDLRNQHWSAEDKNLSSFRITSL